MVILSHRSAIAVAMKAEPPLYRLVQFYLRRLYTAAGAARPLLDPDYNYHYYNSSNLQPRGNRLGASPMADAGSAVPSRGVQWAFIGCPGAKKSGYAGALSKLLQVPHISMASLVRQELHPRSSLYKQIANAVNHGEVVPEEIIFGLLSKRLEDGYYRGETGFILDGIPRSRFQAGLLDKIAEIDLVVNFKCTDDFLVRHQEENALQDKLKAYYEQCKPLEDYYRKQKKLLNFQVGNAPGETWQGLLAALHLQHINAVYSSNKSTAAASSLPD